VKPAMRAQCLVMKQKTSKKNNPPAAACLASDSRSGPAVIDKEDTREVLRIVGPARRGFLKGKREMSQWNITFAQINQTIVHVDARTEEQARLRASRDWLEEVRQELCILSVEAVEDE